MNARLYKTSDYKMLSSWWKAHGWTPVAPEMLPKIGVIVKSEETQGAICAGFLYNTDSKIAILEWVVADPKSDKEERSKALNFLLESLTQLAEKLDYKAVFSYSKLEAYGKRLESHEFIKTDEEMTHYIRRVA